MIQALGKIVQIHPVEKKKSSLILTVEEEKPQLWQVLSVGKDVTQELQAGDTVIIGYGLKTIDLGFDTIYLIEECNILARYKEE
jgi:hypothetical protein